MMRKFWPGTFEKTATVRRSGAGEGYRDMRGDESIAAAQRVLSDPRALSCVQSLTVDVERGCVVRYSVPCASESVFDDYLRTEMFFMRLMRGEPAGDL